MGLKMTEKGNIVLTDLISDPYDGPYEGEDYFIDNDGHIQVPTNNTKLAALIMRKVNQSQQFDKRLVKLNQGGGTIVLGFDTLIDAEPVYTTNIGVDSTLVEVKKDSNDKFCIYINQQRDSILFKKLKTAKTYIKQLDNKLREKIENFDLIDE